MIRHQTTSRILIGKLCHQGKLPPLLQIYWLNSPFYKPGTKFIFMNDLQDKYSLACMIKCQIKILFNYEKEK